MENKLELGCVQEGRTLFLRDQVFCPRTSPECLTLGHDELKGVMESELSWLNRASSDSCLGRKEWKKHTGSREVISLENKCRTNRIFWTCVCWLWGVQRSESSSQKGSSCPGYLVSLRCNNLWQNQFTLCLQTSIVFVCLCLCTHACLYGF